MTDESRPAAEPSPPTELPELLMAAARVLRRSWWEALEPYGLSPHQARALRALTGAVRGAAACATDAGGLRVSDLAGALRIAPRSATEVADGLEERGLVVRAADPADRRAVVLRATEPGRETAQRVDAARVASGHELVRRLGAGDREELARLLRLVVETSRDGDDEPGTAGRG